MLRLHSFVSVFALVGALCCALLGSAGAETTLRAVEHGLRPGSEEAGPALRALLQQAAEEAARTGELCTVVLEPGEYHFYAENAPEYTLYISNHDQQKQYRVGVPLVGMEKVALKGDSPYEAQGQEKRANFVFHGCMLPVLVMDSRGSELANISIRYATPFSSEGRIVAQEGRSTTLEIQPDSRWCVEGGRFFNQGEGWKDKVQVAIAFLEDGRMVPLGRAGDIVWNARAEQVDATRVRFAVDSRALGLSVGQTLVLRSYWRPTPAMLLYRAVKTSLSNVVFHDSMGMGLLAQRSEDIIMGTGGCIRRPGRYGTTGADATHFSNCRGAIVVMGALFEGMMDDAINVHATCLGITRVISPTEVELRYMHPQAIGFEVFAPGERVRFIRGRTLENDAALGCVVAVDRQDERTVRLTLASPLPQGVGVGDAVENADWHPEVAFAHNTVRHNRARGALFTTPEKVLVEGNRFLWSSGSAILLAGDAQGWYESGSCRKVVIRKNVFDHNLTCRFQFTDGIISICPEVKEPGAQKQRYHSNILIEDNIFRTHRVPLLSAISAENVTFRNNKVEYDEVAAPLHGGVPYRLQHCGEMKLQKIVQPAEK